MWKIKIDKEKCIGCGACANECEDNFEVKNGKAEVKKSKIKEIGCNKKAEEICPVDAIKIEGVKS